MSKDTLMRRARRENPVPGDAFDDWPQTDRGREVFQKIVAQPYIEPAQQSRVARRKPIIVLVASGTAALALGAAYTAARRPVETPASIACASTFSQDGDMTIVERVDGQPATATCMSEMRGMWNAPPANPVECVTNYAGGGGGALLVVPAPEGMSQDEACAAIGAALPEEG